MSTGVSGNWRPMEVNRLFSKQCVIGSDDFVFLQQVTHVTGFHLDCILKLKMRAFFWYPPDGHFSHILSRIAWTSSLEFG